MNLNSLTKNELVDLAKLLEQQESAYDEDKLSRYKPHAYQQEFHNSPAKVRIFVGGNRAGKTTCGFMDAIWLCLGIHPTHHRPVPVHGKVYADSFPMLMETIKMKADEWLHPKFLSTKRPFVYNQMGHLIGINFANGSTIKAGSYDQADRKAEGSSYDFVWFDEPPSRNLYVSNMRALVDRDGLCFITATPLSEPWIYDDLWMPGISGEKPYIKCIQCSSDENPYLDKASLELFCSELTESELQVRRYGNFTRLRGLVMETYEPRLSNIEPFKLTGDYVLYEGIDPHPAKPNTVLWKAVHKSGLRYVVKELYWPEGIRSLGKEIVRIRKELQADGAVLIASVADSSLNQDDLAFKMNQYEELKEVLYASGEAVIPKIAHKRGWLDAGIQKMKDLYRPIYHENPEIIARVGREKMPTEYIFDTCVKYKYEMLHYRWPEDATSGNVKPIAKDDDAISCNRYIESLAPQFHTPGSRFTVNASAGAYQRKSYFERVNHINF